MKILKALFYKHKEGILYLFFGGVTTVVNWGSYGILTKYLSFNYNVSNVIAWVLAVAVAFITNKIWVFESKTENALSTLRELASFVGSRIATGIFEVVSLPIAVKLGVNQSILGVDNFLAKIIISIVVVIINYFLSKFIIFKSKR